MIRRDWPLGRDRRPRSLAELESSPASDLRLWLSQSVQSWVEAADNRERVRAFAPLVFAPSEQPDRQTADWWARAPLEDRARFQDAVSDVIETWDPAARVSATTLLIMIGARMESNRGLSPLSALLSKPINLGESFEEWRDLSEAMGYFGTKHGTNQEARDLAYRLRAADLLAPTAAIQLLARAALRYDAAIISDFDVLAPMVTDDPLSDDELKSDEFNTLRRFAANCLVDTLGAPAAFTLALRAHDSGHPELRAALMQHRLEIPSYRRTPDGELLLRDRLTGRRCPVDVRAFSAKLIKRESSVDQFEQRVAESSIEGLLHPDGEDADQ